MQSTFGYFCFSDGVICSLANSINENLQLQVPAVEPSSAVATAPIEDNKSLAIKESKELSGKAPNDMHGDKSLNNKADWDMQQVKARARELLKLPASDVIKGIPKQVFFGVKSGAWGGSTENVETIKQGYLERRKHILEAISRGQEIALITDLDGTIAYKNPIKVNNTRSLGSVNDMHWLRLLVKGLARTNGALVINTARPGILSSPSIVSPEGAGGYRIAEEISGVLEELGVFDLNDPDNQEILKSLQINGLNSGVSHQPGKPVEVKEKVVQYIKFTEFLNGIKTVKSAPEGFLGTLEKIFANSEEKLPMRIFEYKAIPRYFLDQKDAYFSDYIQYMSLVQKSRLESWDSGKFIAELEKSKIKLPEKYRAVLDLNDPNSEERLTGIIRDGVVACLTPHAIDADNVQRMDIKAKAYQAILDLARSPEAQEWAFKNYGIPKGTDLVTINGKSIKHVKKFTGETVEDLIADLNKNGVPPKNDDWILIDVKDNNQPYLEISPNSKKKQAVQGYNDVIKTNEFTIGAGDSPSTDADLLAQGIINGGLGFKVRGLLDEERVMQAVAELLTEERNNQHPFAFKKLNEKEYQRISTGEVKPKAEWMDILSKHYGDRILSAEHIHLNNALNASVFSELFPDLKFNADPRAAWFGEVHKNANKRTLLTPRVDALEKLMDDKNQFPDYKKTLYDSLPKFLKTIPFVSPVLKSTLAIENSPAIFNVFLGIISHALMGAGAVGIYAKVTGKQKLMKLAKIVERVSYGLNNVVSGIGRGLRQSIIFPNQFWGEMLGLASSFFPLTSRMGQTLRALANVTLIGRANEVMMRENYNLDSFAKDERVQKEVEDTFGDQKKDFANIRKPAAVLTKTRMNMARALENSLLGKIPVFGKLLAMTVADLHQSWLMFVDFISTPALRKGAIMNFIRPYGIPKMSKNSGKEYQNVHSPAHLYNFVGVLTVLTGILSTVMGKVFKNDKLDLILTNFANFIPGFGVVAAARLLEQDAAGDPRQFTSVKREGVKFTPEKAGFWQRIGGWGLSAAATILHTDIGQLLLNMSVGAYLKGIQYELPIRLDDSAINERRRTGHGFTQETYDGMPKKELLSFVKDFHKVE